MLKGVDLPLALMFKENFIQPVFGANYIEGWVQPLSSGKLPGNIKFKIWFKEGGSVVIFLKIWRFCLKKLRDAATQNQLIDLPSLV